MTGFLPDGYEIPKAPSNFTKFEKDKSTKIRILPSGWKTDVFICWEYFDTSGDKPVPKRSMTPFKETPGIRANDKQKEVWGLKVYNYETKNVQLLGVTQMSIKKAIQELHMNDDWGDPKGYDLTVKKTGEKLDTEYSLVPSPAKPFDESLLEGKDFDIDWIGFLEGKSEIFNSPEQ